MSYTTHEKIRVESGFQQRFVKESFLNDPDGSVKTFFVRSDDNVRFVPDFNTGNTIAGVSDVQVWIGLSGVLGVSQMAVSSIDIDAGSVTLTATPDSGSSLTISYASSPITSTDIETKRLQAEAIVNQRITQCYDLPISPTPSVLTDLSTRLASALLLIRGYGTGARDTSGDGYALYAQLMGDNNRSNDGNDTVNVGEIGMICSQGYQLVDDNGNIIPRNDEDSEVSTEYIDGGRVRGRLYDVTEEAFRFKPFQEDVNRDQPGTWGTN